MILEQTLRRSVKTEGGVSRVRGITVSVLVKWISANRTIFGITFVTPDQQVDTRLSRIRRDNSGVL